MDMVIQEGAPYVATAYEIAQRRDQGAVRWELGAVYPSGRRTALRYYATCNLAAADAAVLAGRVGRIVVKADQPGRDGASKHLSD